MYSLRYLFINLKKELAVFGGGCFWCTEAIFQRLYGVTSVKPGYAGGTLENPSYEDVCNGDTGHAEVIQVEFNPEQIPYIALLEVFMHTHEPTSLNRQGNDIGPQYRSVIFYSSQEQKEVAEKYIQELSKEFTKPIVTEISPLEVFYPAESYHENYFNKNGYQPYCQVIIAPKVKKFMEKYGKITKKKLES